MTRKNPLQRPHLEGPFVAINIPWPGTPSGFVEWRLVDWTIADEEYPRLPILADKGGDTGAWASDYAVEGPDGYWTFPGGDTCDNAGLAAAFKRREAKH